MIKIMTYYSYHKNIGIANLKSKIQSQNIKCVMFDFDGVVVDSESHWASVENPYLAHHAAGWRNEFYDNLTGLGLDEVYAYLSVNFELNVTKVQYFADYEQMALRLYSDIAKPIGGLEPLLMLLKQKHITAHIVSSSKSAWIKMALNKHGLGVYFDTITSSHDHEIEHGKPAPDVYLRALSKQDIQPEYAIAIEDSANGIIAAKAAGLFCVGLNIYNTSTQDMSNSDVVITNYDHLMNTLR